MTNEKEIRQIEEINLEDLKDIKGFHNITKPITKPPKDDITGMKSGRLTAIRPVGKDNWSHTYWLAECECGNKVILATSYIKKNKTKSCGCLVSEVISKNRTSDLVGKVFRGVTVLKQVEHKVDSDGHRRAQWLCKCNKCGKEDIFLEMNLKKGESDICYECRGVKRRTEYKTDLTGKTFNRWTVIRRATKEETANIKDGHTHWVCRCLCGTIRTISSTHLVSNASVSCGCYAKEQRTKVQDKDPVTGEIIKVEEDLVGRKFYKLTVVEKLGVTVAKRGIRTSRYRCLCDCGGEIITTGRSLRKGKIRSCLCYKRQRIHETHFKDLTGKKFGKLLVLERAEDHIYPTGDKRTVYKCLCDCGNITYVTANNLVNLSTLSCGCILSRGEEIVAGILNKNNIEFKKQKTYKDLVSDKNARLRFDFYIPRENYLIEYDGIYHYKCTGKAWDSIEHYERTKKHDKMKNEYCKKNNIPLIRIPYTRLSKLCLEDLLLETSQFVLK